jgi:hypothetical protein
MPLTTEENQAVLSAKLGAMHDDVSEMKTVLRELTSAITKLALIEQAQVQASLAVERAFKTLEEHSKRLHAIEIKIPELARTSGWVDKVVLIVVTAVLTFGLTQWKG